MLELSTLIYLLYRIYYSYRSPTSEVISLSHYRKIKALTETVIFIYREKFVLIKIRVAVIIIRVTEKINMI